MNRTVHPDVAGNLALAILASSAAPALLLDEDLTVVAGSIPFYAAFALEPQNVAGRPLFKLGAGEWDVPQLRSLLGATLSGHARIEAYEMDLKGDPAPRVQSEEARGHLHAAPHRVMSIATLQQQLTASRLGDVELRGYFNQLCESLGASMIHDNDQVSIMVTADGQ